MTLTPDGASSRPEQIKKIAIDQYRAWGLWIWLKRNNPDLFDQYELEIRKKQVGSESVDNPRFISALLTLLPLLQKQYDEAAAPSGGAEEFASVVPIDLLSATEDIINDKAGFIKLLERRFIEQVVPLWIKKLKESPETLPLIDSLKKESALSLETKKALEAATATIELGALSTQEVRDRLIESVVPLVAENTTAQQLFSATMSDQRNSAYIDALSGDDRQYRSYCDAATIMPVERIDIAAQILRDEMVQNPTDAIEVSITRAICQTQLLELYGARSIEDVANTPGAKAAFSSFFQALAETDQERAAAPVADALISLLAVKTRAHVIQLVVARVFEKTINSPTTKSLLYEGVHERVSRLLASSALYQSVGGRFLVDGLTSVFGRPKKLLMTSIEDLSAHWEDLARYFGHPVGHETVRPQTHRGAYHVAGSWAEAAFLFWIHSHDGAMFILRRAFPSFVGSGWLRGEAAGLIFRWGSGPLLRASAAATGLVIKRAFVGTIAAFLTGPIGLFVALVGPGIVGKIKSKALGLLHGALSVVGLGGGTKGLDSPASLATIAVVAALVVAFASMLLVTTTLGVAFSTTYDGQGGLAQGETDRDVLQYGGPLPTHISSISHCPIPAGFRITQAPFEPGSLTHRRVDAFDYAAPAGTPVVAAHDGFLVPNHAGGFCLNHPEYGTYVRLAARSVDGPIETRYAHLSDCAKLSVYNKNGEPALVAAGTIIGYVGSSGKSTGPHLHFEIKGPRLLTTLLPSSCGGTQ